MDHWLYGDLAYQQWDNRFPGYSVPVSTQCPVYVHTILRLVSLSLSSGDLGYSGVGTFAGIIATRSGCPWR